MGRVAIVLFVARHALLVCGVEDPARMHHVVDPSDAWLAKDLEQLAPVFGIGTTESAHETTATHVIEKQKDSGKPSSFMKAPKKAVAPLEAPSKATPTEAENPKCDQLCTNGSEGTRKRCMFRCSEMQKKVCPKDFKGCAESCQNGKNEVIPKDMDCQKLCEHVREKICSDLGYQAPKNLVSPHHDDKVPPSVEATPAPKIWKGSFVFCNLYPSSYEFDVLALSGPEDKSGKKMTKLGYKQCAKVSAETLQTIGLRTNSSLAAVSKPITKIPSVMIFGQWALGNHQVEFNRYYARGAGAYLCNGYPAWEKVDIGEPVVFYRGGYKGVELATLRYKECVPTALKSGDIVSAKIHNEEAGEYKVFGNPLAIVLGKAGTSRGVAFEAWQGSGEVSFEQTEM